jgi:arylsulfatase A
MNNKQVAIPGTLLAGCLSFAGCMNARQPVAALQEEKPNVVLIMADDLGYFEMGCYGHPTLKTPALDKLAKEGVRLTSFYAGSTVCTPSRLALLTGSYAARVGWSKGVVGYMIPTNQGLAREVTTMAEVFKGEGYRTALIGKWHVGDPEPLRPHRQGFDDTYYLNKSNNDTRILWQGDTILEKPFNNAMLTKQFTDKAIEFIKRDRSQPFFLYLPYTAPHTPVNAHPDWKGTSAYRLDGRKDEYGDVVEELDHRIGEIIQTLKDEGRDRNTIVVFLSDNGPEGARPPPSGPLRGRKWDALEGGNRVPCIVWAPGRLPEGKVCDTLSAAIDLLPTLTYACGIDIKSSSIEQRMDGVNIWETLTGDKSKPARKDLLIWHGSQGLQAIRVGQWKLYFDGRNSQLPEKKEGPVLFNLEEDVGETTDLSARYPDKVNMMTQLASKRLADIRKNSIPFATIKKEAH